MSNLAFADTETGYLALPVGTRYIRLEGRAVSIGALAGHSVGGSFYPAGEDRGYPIRVRRETARELAAAKGEALRARPGVGAGFDPSDWR